MLLRIAVIFVITIISFQNSLAQSSGERNRVSVNVTAQIISRVEVITLQNILFKESSFDKNIIDVSPIKDTNAGFLKASGKAGAQVRIMYPIEKIVNRSAGNGSLQINYSVAVNGTNDQSTANLVLKKGNIYNLNENGELFLWVGGRVDISNAVPGTYIGNFKIEIEYI